MRMTFGGRSAAGARRLAVAVARSRTRTRKSDGMVGCFMGKPVRSSLGIRGELDSPPPRGDWPKVPVFSSAVKAQGEGGPAGDTGQRGAVAAIGAVLFVCYVELP